MPAKKNSPSPSSECIFIVTGSDEADVKKTALNLAQKLSPSDDPFATEIIDGIAATAEDAVQKIQGTIEALLTVSMFGGEKLVWLKSANFFADSVLGRSDDVARALEKLIDVLRQGLPQGVRFLLSAPEADKRRTAYKSLVKLGKCEVCDKPDFGFGGTEADIASWIEERAEKAGLLLIEDAAMILAARVGADTRQIDIEIQKLLVASGESPVGDRMVRELVPSTRQGGIFDLSNAISSRDLPSALDIVRQLLRQKETAVGLLLAAITPTFRNLLLVKDLMERHRLQAPAKPFYFSKTLERLPDEAIAHLPRKKDGSLNTYPLGVAACGACNYDLGELRRALLRCRDLNRALVTTSLSEELQLGRFLVEVLGRAETKTAGK
jgi:DNA polymerase-3 subunit delta